MSTPPPLSEAQDELKEVLRTLMSDMIVYGGFTKIEKFLIDLMAWHLKHSGQRRDVTRKDIEDAYVTCNWNPEAESVRQVIDKLFALLNGHRKEPEWCCHWKWNETLRCWDGTVEGGMKGVSALLESWDICPVAGCHAKRPEERT